METISHTNDPVIFDACVTMAVATYEQMTPDSIAAVWREFSAHDDSYDEALAVLPGRNPEFGEAVYRTIAESADSEDRGLITIWLPELCKVNPLAGAELWNHLIRDPDEGVRANAVRRLNEAIEVISEPGAKEIQDQLRQRSLGLDWQDIANLYRVHIETKGRPHTQYQPGVPSAHDDRYSQPS